MTGRTLAYSLLGGAAILTLLMLAWLAVSGARGGGIVLGLILLVVLAGPLAVAGVVVLQRQPAEAAANAATCLCGVVARHPRRHRCSCARASQRTAWMQSETWPSGTPSQRRTGPTTWWRAWRRTLPRARRGNWSISYPPGPHSRIAGSISVPPGSMSACWRGCNFRARAKPYVSTGGAFR